METWCEDWVSRVWLSCILRGGSPKRATNQKIRRAALRWTKTSGSDVHTSVSNVKLSQSRIFQNRFHTLINVNQWSVAAWPNSLSGGLLKFTGSFCSFSIRASRSQRGTWQDTGLCTGPPFPPSRLRSSPTPGQAPRRSRCRHTAMGTRHWGGRPVGRGLNEEVRVLASVFIIKTTGNELVFYWNTRLSNL